MKYEKHIQLKNGAELLLRSGTEADGEAVLENFNLVHGETDFLVAYPDEASFDAAQEGQFLKQKEESPHDVMIVAVVDGSIVGTAGIFQVGVKYKLRHRAEMGISVLKAFWGLGIGSAMLEACIECASSAGYVQLELDAVADNTRAISLYRKYGFVEFGRNPKGFLSRTNGYQELVLMRLELRNE